MKFKESEFAQRITPSKTLAITALVADLRSKGKSIIALGAGEPDFDTPDFIKAAGIKAIQQGKTKYTPNTGTIKLREAIARHLKGEYGVEYDIKQIVCSNGAKQCVHNTILAVCNPGDEVLIISPYWVSYPEQIKMASAVPKVIYADEENDFKITPAALEKAITAKVKLIILNNPSNPTGSVYSADELKALVDVIKEKQVFVLSDEIYIKLIYGSTTSKSLTAFPEIYDRLFLVNGFSKTYAMTGWRIGYVAGPLEGISSIAKIQSHTTSNACSISQEAGLVALEREDVVLKHMKDEFEKRRDYVYMRLNELPGITARKPDGAFYIFANIEELLNKTLGGKLISSPTVLAEVLVESAGVALVGGEAFGSDKHIRISYATSMDNLKEAMSRVQNFLE